MAYHFSIISALAFLSFLVVLYVFVEHLRKGEKTEVNTSFSLFLLAILVWGFGSIFEASADSDPALLFWKQFAGVGIPFVGVLWLAIALNLTTGDGHIRLFRWKFLLLLAPGLASLGALFTNETHHLFYRELSTAGIVFGPFAYLATFFFFLYMGVGVLLYIVQFLQHREWYYRRQSLYMAVGAVLPLAAHLVYVARAGSHPWDATPITFSISALAFLLTISRLGLFDIIPIAHRHMVESMRDGVIVIDRGGTIVEINLSAREILGVGPIGLIGKSSGDVTGANGHERLGRILRVVERAPSSILDVVTTLETFPDLCIDVSISNIRGEGPRGLGKLAVIRDVTEQVQTERQLHELSIRDDLTRLYNQRYFYRLLNREVHRADRQGHGLSLLVLDIDNFKEYNDRFGHIEGNKVLARVGEILLENIRGGVDTAFRFGGDEFTVVLPEADIEQTTQIGERIRSSFEASRIHHLTLSVGVAAYDRNGEVEDLFEMADQAMYRAKRQGRNRLQIISAGRSG